MSSKEDFGCNGCLANRGHLGPDVHLPMEAVDEESVNMDTMTPMTYGVDPEHAFRSRLVSPQRMANQRRAVRIDEFCRFIFPLGFIFFNIFYWNYYKEENDLD